LATAVLQIANDIGYSFAVKSAYGFGLAPEKKRHPKVAFSDFKPWSLFEDQKL